MSGKLHWRVISRRSQERIKMKEPLYDMKWLMARFDSSDMLKFIYFWGHTDHDTMVSKSCLSPWYVAPFMVDGVAYQSAEH